VFQERHENKDAYDLIFTLLHADEEPAMAGAAAASSPVAGHDYVTEALTLLGERFRDVNQYGPSAYALFLAASGDAEPATHTIIYTVAAPLPT